MDRDDEIRLLFRQSGLGIDEKMIETIKELLNVSKKTIPELYSEWEAFSINNKKSFDSFASKIHSDSTRKNQTKKPMTGFSPSSGQKRTREETIEPSPTLKKPRIHAPEQASTRLDQSRKGENFKEWKEPVNDTIESVGRENPFDGLSGPKPKENLFIREKTNTDPGLKMEKYMYNVASVCAKQLDKRTSRISKLIKETMGDPGQKFFPAHVYSKEPTICCGRIAINYSEDDLTEDQIGPRPSFTNLVLESSASSQPTPLNLQTCVEPSGCALFPGQIVALRGKNPTGNEFEVLEIHHPPAPALTPTPDIKSHLHIAIAAGPFFPKDTVEFQPYLEYLIKEFKDTKPKVDLVILMGPFIDDSNLEIACASKTVEELFGEFVEWIKKESFQVVMIPSQKDISHNFDCFPQPKFTGNYSSEGEITMVSNPTVFTVGCKTQERPLNIGGCTADILSDLKSQAFPHNKPGTAATMSKQALLAQDQIYTMIKWMFQQRSFYPLYPPGPNCNLDLQFLDLLTIDALSHLFILPSNLSAFARKIEHVLVVNPGRVYNDEKTSGSFALVQISPITVGNVVENSFSEIKSIKWWE